MAPQSVIPVRTNGHTNEGLMSSRISKWALLCGGSALAAYGIVRRSKTGIGLAAVGSLMAVEGTRLSSDTRDFRARSSFAINCAPSQAYNYWRKLDNLPAFMSHLASVRMIDDRRSEWVAIGPLGTKIRWTAEIVDEEQEKLIAWRSVPGSLFRFSGSVEFLPETGGRGTVVIATMSYAIPGGALGKTMMSIFGKNPEFLIREDLRKFKALMESGEIPTTEGQPHGRRSKIVSALHATRSRQEKTVHYAASESAVAESRAL